MQLRSLKAVSMFEGPPESPLRSLASTPFFAVDLSLVFSGAFSDDAGLSFGFLSSISGPSSAASSICVWVMKFNKAVARLFMSVIVTRLLMPPFDLACDLLPPSPCLPLCSSLMSLDWDRAGDASSSRSRVYWLRPFFLCDRFLSTFVVLPLGAAEGGVSGVGWEEGGTSGGPGRTVFVPISVTATTDALVTGAFWMVLRAASGNSSEGSESVSPW